MIRQPRPTRSVRSHPTPAGESSRPGLIGLGVLWTLITAGVLFFVLPIIARQTADEATLKARGVSISAVALRVWSTPGGRGGPAYHLAFRFTPEGREAPTTTQAYISAREAAAIRTPSQIPVIYDPVQPQLAALNMGDKVHRRRPRLEGVLWSAFLVVLVGGVWAGFISQIRGELRAARAVARTSASRNSA